MTLPVLFIGHGSPMNAIVDNPWSRAWSALGARLPRPRAVLVVSAHWCVRETAVTAMVRPRTIHDFGGFPPALYAVDYPAPGDPALAARIRALLAPQAVRADPAFGLDHGAWSVLRRLFPDADVPVVQLAMDAAQPPAFHHALGRALRPLRDEGVLVLASGNVVHNLRAYARDGRDVTYPWALRLDERVRGLLLARDREALVGQVAAGGDARLALPTPEHFLPLLYALGASFDDDAVSFPVQGFDGGAISMLGVEWSRAA